MSKLLKNIIRAITFRFQKFILLLSFLNVISLFTSSMQKIDTVLSF